MSVKREQLFGQMRRLLTPATLSNLGVATVAWVFAALSLRIPPDRAGYFAAAAVLAMGVVLGCVEIVGHRSLTTFRGISGALDLSHAHLKKALIETRELPLRLAHATAMVWVAVAVAGGLSMRMLAQSPWPNVGRVLLMGVVFGPIAGLLCQLLVSLRSRAVVELLAKGLRLDELVKLWPSGTALVRWRVVGFTAVVVVLSSVAVGDLARNLSRDGLERVLQAQGAVAQSMALTTARIDVLGRVGLLVMLIFALALIAAWAFGRALAEPMQRVALEATRLKGGELAAPKLIAAEYEGWAVTSTFTMMNAHLFQMMHQLSSAGVQISATTEELLQTSGRYEAGASEQASSLNQTSTTTEELAGSARQISIEASSVSQSAQRTLEVAQKGQTTAEEFIHAVERMRRENRSIASAVDRLKKRVQQIGRIVEFINAVADRSDLLALSAELEGTKAGEVGRAFSLVASEMRRLAENVIESTNEIEELIAEIREATAATVGATEVGLKQTEGGIALAAEVISSLGRIVELAKRTFESSRAISLATQQQQTGTDQLAESMADILGITQQSLASTKRVTSANNDLMALSIRLKGLVDTFRIRA
ncbi:MAG: methyl-accepting chemotaxis protein [Myxococcaceae bacterium]|nr:methyl-accepting chemotaxis protein [Myxococcaceae bacterium]